MSSLQGAPAKIHCVVERERCKSFRLVKFSEGRVPDHEDGIDPDEVGLQGDDPADGFMKPRCCVSRQPRHELESDEEAVLPEQGDGVRGVGGSMPAAREQEHLVVHGLGSEFNGADMILLQEGEDARRDSVRPCGQADARYPAC